MRPWLDLRWPATYTGSTEKLAYNPIRPKWPTPKANSHYNTYCFIHNEFYRGLALSASIHLHTVSVRKTRLNVLSFTRVHTP